MEHISADLGGFVRAVFSIHDPDVLASALRDVGLRDVTATVKRATLWLPAPAEFLWQYISITPMGPIVAQAAEEARKAMESDVVERLQPHVTESGGVGGGQPMVIAIGWK